MGWAGFSMTCRRRSMIEISRRPAAILRPLTSATPPQQLTLSKVGCTKNCVTQKAISTSLKRWHSARHGSKQLKNHLGGWRLKWLLFKIASTTDDNGIINLLNMRLHNTVPKYDAFFYIDNAPRRSNWDGYDWDAKLTVDTDMAERPWPKLAWIWLRRSKFFPSLCNNNFFGRLSHICATFGHAPQSCYSKL